MCYTQINQWGSVFDLSSRKSCPYEECVLPENNYRYLWQVCYTLFGLFVLYRSRADFNFFQTFLFLTPIMIDIAYTKFKSTAWNVLRWGFGIINAILILACLMGMVGILKDTGESFMMVGGALYFQGIKIKKTFIGKIMAANLVIPFVCLAAVPCKKTMNSIVGYTELGGVKQ